MSCFYRAEIWLEKCKRTDLMSELQNLWKNRNVCAAHFESRMFTNRFQNRLKYDAIPTIFSYPKSPLLPAALADHTYARNYMCENKINILQNIILVPGKSIIGFRSFCHKRIIFQQASINTIQQSRVITKDQCHFRNHSPLQKQYRVLKHLKVYRQTHQERGNTKNLCVF